MQRTLGQKLKQLRIEKEMTLDDLATELGLTRQAIFNYETDARVPRDEIKVLISSYFGKTVQEIFLTKKATKRC